MKRVVVPAAVVAAAAAASAATPGMATAASMDEQYRPPPQLRVSVDGLRPPVRLGAWCWERRPRLPRQCLHYDYGRCSEVLAAPGLPPPPPPGPPCSPALVSPAAALAIDTRWAAKSVRVTLRAFAPNQAWRLRTYRSGRRRFLVRVPAWLGREVRVDFSVRYARGLSASWHFPLELIS